MSRFSRKTASGLGYLLFAMIGGSAYWFFKNDHIDAEQLAAAERSKISLPVVLGSSLDCATELSTFMTQSRFNDPVVNLSSKHVPTWASGKSIEDLDELVSVPGRHELPPEYPHGAVRPLAMPRSGNAIVKEPKTTVLSLAPPPAAVSRLPSTDQLSTNAIPMVPVRSALSPPQPIAAAIPQPTEKPAEDNWQNKGRQMLQDIGRTLMKPPPQSTVAQSSSTQRVVLSRKPIVKSDVEPASSLEPAADRARQKPSTSVQSNFIVQPLN
jgi:hypothetical protein